MQTSKFEKENKESSKGSGAKSKNKSYTKQSSMELSKGTNKRSCNKRDNDPSWYTAYPGIYSATANINFNQPVGIPADITDDSGSVIGTAGSQIAVPNVMSMGITFTPGISDSASSIVNTAMFQNYNFVRHANSGSKNYDAVDLQMYYLAVNDALAYLWHGIRAYGTIATFSALNRSIPKTLFKGYGLDYNSWIANPAQLRAQLNLAATKMASLCVPANSRLSARMQYLMQNVFMDGSSIKSQMYVFVPRIVHTWGRLSNVGKLTAKLGMDVSSPITVDAYLDILNSMIQPLLEDEDINIMSGDVLKAYGEGGLLPIPMTPDYYATPVITSNENPYMMSQIENMSWTDIDPKSMDITQSVDGHIIYQPQFKYPNTDVHLALSTVKVLLNSRNPEVTNDEIMELTRLAPAYDSTLAEGNFTNLTVRACGTELPLDTFIITQSSAGAISQSRLYKVYAKQDQIPSEYFMFDWAPIVYQGTVALIGDKLQGVIQRVYGDLSNFTAISKHTAALIHDTAVASEMLLDTPNRLAGSNK